MNLMLRSLIFICVSTWTWCSAAWLIFPCISTWTCCCPACSTWTWCSAACSVAWPSLAVLHGELDAPLLDLHLHFYMNLRPRCLTFTCNSTWTWCPAAWSSLACLVRASDQSECTSERQTAAVRAALSDNRGLIFTSVSTWTSCSAARSLFAFLNELDAPLLDFHLRFYMNLMPRCLIDLHLHFDMNLLLPCLLYMNLMLRCLLRCLTLTCSSTWWTWCSAARSSLAFLHELDAPMLDFHLRHYITCCSPAWSTWTWCSAACSAAWPSLAILHELDAPLLNLHLHY